jgi:ferredoxin
MQMIITEKKPMDELLSMLEGYQKLALVGCGNCAAACQTGGEKEIEALKAYLQERGFEVVATVLPEECCHKMLVKKETKILRDCGAEAIVGMACGDGVQTVADNIQLPIYPANNTMFLGQIERVGIFHEYCRMCGDCVLGSTGGICPITKCAKSLVNGPCGGQKNGKCEVNPENDCAWIQIYHRLEALGRLEDLEKTRPHKGHAGTAYPRHINLRGKKV